MTTPIAIVGIGGVFPQSPDLDTFWDHLVQGRDLAADLPAHRLNLELDGAFDPEIAKADKVYARRGYFVDDRKLKPDYARLKVSEKDIEQLDPMFKVGLTAAQRAFDDAVMEPVDLQRTGLIIGNIVLPTEASSALARNILGRAFEEKVVGKATSGEQAPHPLNTRVAGLPGGIITRALSLGGGSYTLDAACASSLYALKLAADELIAGRADAMITGGLSRPDCLYTQMGFSQLRALSTTGTASPFDRKANGLVVGEGSGMFVLKRLDDALAAGDHIYALVRGAGLSNDLDGSLLAPDSEGQLRAMRSAYQQAGWQPWDVDMIECHATGTPLGDGVEVRSLDQLWEDAPQGSEAVIGSIKANVGHLLTAAGSAALIKTLLAMKHGAIPPTANFQNPPDDLDYNTMPFRVLQKTEGWPQRDRPARAAVSAFGFGGINAHLLIEAWQEQAVAPRVTNTEPQPIAIVGMDAHFGPWKGLDAFRDRVFGADDQKGSSSKPNWWGLEDKAPEGYYIPKLEIPFGRFRIPPKEMMEMLPQQLLMLLVAERALADAGHEPEPARDAGVFVGIGLDLNTTNYQLRWNLEERARHWSRVLGLDTDEETLQQWVAQLRKAMGPALNANRVIGGLGSITASRIAREFRFGGQGFTISSEESSGIRSLEAAVRALQQGILNKALVGGVDFAGEVRAAMSDGARHDFSPSGTARPFDQQADGTLPGEGAVALVLERLEDAEQSGKKIYGVIRGIGVAGELSRAIERAASEAGAGTIDYLETDARGLADRDHEELEQITAHYPKAVLGSITADLGSCGAASGLVAVARAALVMKYRRFPALRNLENPLSSQDIMPQQPRHWVRDRVEGPRRAAVNSQGEDGTCAHVILQEHGAPLVYPMDRNVLVFVEGNSQDQLITELEILNRRSENADLFELERSCCMDSSKKLAVAIVASSITELRKAIDAAVEAFRNHSEKPDAHKPYLELVRGRRLFYSADPLGEEARIAFVYPGSGSHFADMGRELALQWPDVYEDMSQTTQYIAEELCPDIFWSGKDMNEVKDQHAMLLSAQVALGVTVSDLVRRFGLNPKGAIGYSLGESTALLSLGGWRDRDGMHTRTRDTSLFREDLAGPCNAARKVWGLKDDEDVDWTLGVVICSAEKARDVLENFDRAYLLIVNTPRECVIGGDRTQVMAAVDTLETRYFPLHGVVTVHCEVLEPVEKAYRNHHLFPTTPPEDIRFYSGARGAAYELNRESAADAVTAQARHGVDFPKTIRAAHEDGFNVFLEMGPGSSCTRMINKILSKSKHMAVSACFPGNSAVTNILRMLGRLITERIPVDLTPLQAAAPMKGKTVEETRSIEVPVGGLPFDIPQPPRKPAPVITMPSRPAAPHAAEPKPVPPVPERAVQPQLVAVQQPVAAGGSLPMEELNQQTAAAMTARAQAHEAFLRFAERGNQAMTANLQHQMNLLQALGGAPADFAVDPPAPGAAEVQEPRVAASAKTVVFDRDMCMEFAIGSIGRMLGPGFAEIDSYPSRVRLPDEPLMLVDRITHLEGKPMESGQVITEHDVLVDGWYLDCGRIPTCIAIEAGQADLFLSAWLGADFATRGLSNYRLLDAQVTFHGELPKPGEVIVYDIRILRFFRQANTHFFYFQFEGSVNGRPLLTMLNGCAGFFSPQELAAGKGVVRSKDFSVEKSPQKPEDLWRWLPVEPITLDQSQLDALRRNDLAAAFGPSFNGLPIQKPVGLPDGRMNLVHRVTVLDPAGGDYGIGLIKAEADVKPDDWFLTCHFVDDMVMPGTLMYECCLHTMRVFLYRMGWVGEASEVVCQPVIGVASQLKCRGQVLESTKVVTYEVHIKKVGYDPEPYAIADALMYSDSKAIVDISDMCIRFSGLTLEKLERTWWGREKTLLPDKPAKPFFTYDQLHAFALGKPSEAFGNRYKPFDNGRKIARFPNPPFLLMSRVEQTDVKPWTLTEGGKCRVAYDVPPDAWYFRENRQPVMPYSILLEIALQSCGWLAAYMGSALYSKKDLLFRNLGGNATQHMPVTPDMGTLKTHVTVTSISRSGDVILQFFDYRVECDRGPVFTGDTYFGFFTEESMATQVGIRDEKPFEPGEDVPSEAQAFRFPDQAPFPAPMMRMVDHIDVVLPDNGAHGRGFIEGSIDVDPSAWFFKAHFYQDPVWPGSLGLESFIQVMEAYAHNRWGTSGETRIQSPVVDARHTWVYRGQIVPSNKRVRVQASIKDVDDANRILIADGFLLVDDLPIYQMIDFTLQMS